MIKQERSLHLVETIFKPILALGTVNSAYIAIAGHTLNYLADKPWIYENLAIPSATVGLSAGLIGINKKLIPLSWEMAKKRINRWKNKEPIDWASSYTKMLGTGFLSLCLIASLNTFNGSKYYYNNFSKLGNAGKAFFESYNKEDQISEDKANKFIAKNITKKEDGSLSIEGREKLEGILIGKYASKFLGINGRIPASVEVDYKAHLKHLWTKKAKDYGDKMFSNFYFKKIDPRKAFKKSSIDDYLIEIGETIDSIKTNIDWQRVKYVKLLSENDINSLQKISETINQYDLMSFIMTEITPTNDGNLNYDLLDLVLRNGGKDYIEFFPSLYDSELSYGPYQLTPKILGKKPLTGASFINLALPKKNKIPDDIEEIEGNEHHAAAYLLAVNSLADLMNSLDSVDKEFFKKNWKNHKSDLMKYIATAHHRPKEALKAAEFWVGNKMKYDFTVSCPKEILEYSRKTRDNLNTLYSKHF